MAADHRQQLQRVAFFLHGLEAGGAQKRTAQLASGIAALGVAVVLIDGSGPNRVELSPDVGVVEIDAPWARRLYRGADAIVAIAPGLRDEVVREVPELAAHTSLVINPVIDSDMPRQAAASPDPA